MAAISNTTDFSELKPEYLPRTAEEKKKLVGLLLDPRVIALAENDPERKEAIANIVRKLQAERDLKKLRKNGEPEPDKEHPWTRRLLSTFDCTNIARMFANQPSEKQYKQRKRCCHNPIVAGAGDPGSLGEIATSLSRYPRAKSTTSREVQPQQGFNNITLKEANVQFNGVNMPSSVVLRKKYEEITVLLLQKAGVTSPSVFFSFMPNEAKIQIHDLDGYNCTNRKSACIKPILTISHDAVKILEPANIVEDPMYSLPFQSSLDLLRTYVASSTQTDIFETCSYCYECEIADGSDPEIMNDDRNPKYEEVKAVRNGLPYSSPGYLNCRRKNDISRVDSEASSCLESKCSNSEVFQKNGLSSSSEDSEGGICHPFDDASGARELAKIIKKSNGPDKRLVRPEVVITGSGRNSCTGNCCQSDGMGSEFWEQFCTYDASSCETIILEDGHRANRWPRKRMKTSCHSYYADVSDARIYKTDPSRLYLCISSDAVTDLNGFGQKPPEISTGYSQLSYKESNNYSSESIHNIGKDLHGITYSISKENFKQSEIRNAINNVETCGNMVDTSYDESTACIGSQETSLMKIDCYENISATESIERLEHSNNINIGPRSPHFLRKMQRNIECKVQECPELSRRASYPLPRPSSSAMSVIVGQQCLMNALSGDNANISIHDEVIACPVEIPNSQKGSVVSSELDLDTLELLENQTCLADGDVSSSEEEQRRLYERNLEMMKMKLKADEQSLSSSRPGTPPLPPWKAKRQKNRSHQKSKTKSKNNNCSIL